MKIFFAKKIVWLVLAVLVVGGFGLINSSKNDGSENDQKNLGVKDNEVFSYLKDKSSKYPACPDNLEGVLTAPLMEPKYIAALTPLGNINPPGHTSPVDHIYFATQEKEKIPLYAPANAWITEITEIAYKNESGEYIDPEYSLRYTICDGLDVVFASYTELVPGVKAEVDRVGSSSCTPDIEKIGHTRTERQCHYNVSIPVKSGDLIGSVRAHSDGKLPFEIWAFNFNKLSRTDIDWAFYEKDSNYPYPRAFCLFDLYTGDLKSQYYSKFGSFDNKDKMEKDHDGNIISQGGYYFTPRTIEPLCGQVNQDITGTIQGMWYGENNPDDKDIEAKQKGLAFIHNNIDPRVAEISVGGNFMSYGIISFDPTHSGMIGREFSEVKVDGKVYCYNSPGGWGPDIGKILVQLIGDRELKVEHQEGNCGENEVFKTPFNYYR